MSRHGPRADDSLQTTLNPQISAAQLKADTHDELSRMSVAELKAMTAKSVMAALGEAGRRVVLSVLFADRGGVELGNCLSRMCW